VLQYVVQFEPSQTVWEGAQGFGHGELQIAACAFACTKKQKAAESARVQKVLLAVFSIRLASKYSYLYMD